MNEKIKELAIRSQIVSEYLGELISPYAQPCDMSEEVQEFAELLIRECATLVDTSDSSKPYTTFGEQLKAHFGVKE